MALSDFVSVQISLSALPLSRPGFGTPLLLAADAPAGFTERVRTYNEADELLDDGFVVTGPTYLLAQAVCAQNPRPPKFKVGRLALKPTQKFTVTPTAVNSATYRMTVAGQPVEYTADGSATAAEIVTGLKAAIAALDDVPAITTSGTSTLVLTADVAGAFFDVGVDDLSLLSIVQDHADPGVATDLAAIKVADNDWYCLLNAFNSEAMVNAAAAWAETAKKLFLFDTIDSTAVTTVSSGATDLVADQKTSARFWTSAWYQDRTGYMLAASVAGALLPTDPGSETWAFKTPSGPVASRLTATQRTNLLNKNGNLLEVVGDPDAGLSITNPGKVGSGEWIDVVRLRDWIEANVAADVFDTLRGANNAQKKLPYTDAGIQAVKGAILAVLKRAVAVGGLSDNPAPTVTVPKAADVSGTDKSNRVLTGVKFSATLAGAIHAVTPIQGTLTA
jgi:hypothetical protein